MLVSLTDVRDHLLQNRFDCRIAKNKEAVIPLVAEWLAGSQTVATGGSDTLFACGVIDFLRKSDYTFIDRHREDISPAELAEVFHASKQADTYLCSSNAVTQDGFLYNVDGNSNRISAIAHGPRSVIIIAGRNKIVRDLDEAVQRVKTICAPQICRRSGRDTYCSKTGHCLSKEPGAKNMTAGCRSPERACCNYLVSGWQRFEKRIKVILVDEALGL